jgi:hypothetical protein
LLIFTVNIVAICSDKIMKFSAIERPIFREFICFFSFYSPYTMLNYLFLEISSTFDIILNFYFTDIDSSWNEDIANAFLTDSIHYAVLATIQCLDLKHYIFNFDL